MYQEKNDLLKIAIIVLVSVAIGAFGIFWFMDNQAGPAVDASSEKIVQFNCEQSGGTFADGACGCTDATYEAETGYCIEAFGTPGGELGDTARKLQELRMLQAE